MSSLLEDLKQFILQPKENSSIIYEAFKKKDEYLVFEISSEDSSEYFYLCSDGSDPSVRGCYKLNGMEEEASIVCDVIRVEKPYAIIMIRSLKIRFKIDASEKKKVIICPL